MSLKGKWRIVEMPDFEADYPDMVEPAYILFEETGGEFASAAAQGTSGQQAAPKPPASTSHGTEVTKWTKSTETVPPNSSPMALLKVKSATIMATNIPSSPVGPLLQQPAKSGLGRPTVSTTIDVQTNN
ncbi:MAG: hypothetical protein WDN06_05590 [Asticcacaulis sp.]